jgi:hypothetical protein
MNNTTVLFTCQKNAILCRYFVVKTSGLEDKNIRTAEGVRIVVLYRQTATWAKRISDTHTPTPLYYIAFKIIALKRLNIHKNCFG